jgi:hypothetical protein
MKKKSDFSWFDLSKYDSVKNLDITNWFLQLKERFVVQRYSKSLPEKKMSYQNWETQHKHAQSIILSIKENPILNCDKQKIVPSSSVTDSTYFDLYTAQHKGKHWPNIFKLSIDEWPIGTEEELLTSVEDTMTYLDTPMVTIDSRSTDEQLKSDFDKWLNNYRSITRTKKRKKMFNLKEIEKWCNNKILPYIDLTIISESEGEKLTQHTIGQLLYPDEYDVDLTERIRQTVKPLAKSIFNINTLKMLELQVKSEINFK